MFTRKRLSARNRITISRRRLCRYGGASIVEFKVDVPGKYILVDHALARLDRGAWGIMTAEGSENKEIFDGEPDTPGNSGH